MRKIFFISMVIGMSFVNTPAYCEDIPEPIKEMVLKDLGFYEPIEKPFTPRLFMSQNTITSISLEAFATQEGIGNTILWRDKFFIPNGYLRKSLTTKFEKGKFDWGEYEKLWSEGGVKDILPTEKLRPYLKVGRNETVIIALAKRVLKSIDYTNKWKLNDLDTWSFTFTYFLEPVFPELPKVGPCTGQGTAMINPATGKFDTVTEKDVGRRYGSSLGDRGYIEYDAWLEKQTTTKPESSPPVGAPSPNPSETTLSQPSSQAPSETTEKITIDSLTKNLPYGDRNAGRFQAIEKTYNVTFDDAWAAANKVISEQREAIATSDRDKGILIGQGEGMGAKHWTAATIEKVTEYSVKIAVKNVTYTNRGDVDSWDSIFYKNLEKELKSKVKQPSYSVTVDGKQYKVSGDVFTGKKEGRVFKDEKGVVVRDLVLAKKIAHAAWVYENVVKAPGIPASQRVSAILETYKDLRRYELAQDILARASVQILAATISRGATLTYTVPAGLTWRVVRDQFANLKGLLSLTGRQGLEEALSKYQQMESLIANLKPNHIDEATAAEIKNLYDSAYGLDLPYSALLTSLMPKQGHELVDEALKDIGDELVKTLPLSDAVLTTSEVLDLQGKMDDALKASPAFKEYYEKLNLAKRLTEANEQVITVWAESAVQHKD
jgi:hypothetical protein